MACIRARPGNVPDVSADLVELSRTPGLLVCSGPKSIVDPAATAERLEELGVSLIGYGVDRLPFFLAREAQVELEHRVDTPGEAAAALGAALALDTRSTLLLCNPIDADLAMDADEVAAAAARCEERADREGVRGRALTPFLLACLAEETGGRSLEANLGAARGERPARRRGRRRTCGVRRRLRYRSQVWMITFRKFQP